MSITVTPCQLCGETAMTDALDFGPQPISNRFLRDQNGTQARFPLALGACRACGLVQMLHPIPAAELIPRYSWITYNEPERHLDELAATIAAMPGIDRNQPVWGLSFKDDSLLRRLAELGFTTTHRLDLATDLDVQVPGAGVEVMQERFTPDRATSLAASHGRPGVIIARHCVEHAQRLGNFLDAIRALLATGGYSVIEIPDCEVAFRLGDYTTVWEERAAYFTPATFPAVFRRLGQTCVSLQTFENRPENILVGIGRAESARSDAPSAAEHETLDGEVMRFTEFRDGLAPRRQQIVDALSHHGTAAILGAGHLTIAFVSYLGLQDRFTYVVDDNPNKQGLFMPGSRLPIKPSSALLDGTVSLCLLSVNPEIEQKVVDKNQAFVSRGGKFASIFPASPRFIGGRVSSD